MESKTSRYQSRILREMHQNTENPFNSPPSSTGSHGTITLTSNLTMGPQGESTRRMDDLSIKLPSQAAIRSAKGPRQASFNVNTSALGRTFPEWSRWNPNSPEHEKDMWETASDRALNPEGKENVTPRGSPNSSVVATPRADDSDRDKVEAAKAANSSKAQSAAPSRGTFRTRAQMQPRVQTESECSLDLSESFAQPHRDIEESEARPRVPTPNGTKGPKPRRGNVTALLETLKTAQTKQAESKDQPIKQSSPRPLPLAQPHNAAKIHMERQSRMSNVMSPATPNQTARSFFLPNLSYMNDFLSGALRLSSFRNGMPVFVKHGKVHDRESTISPDYHADVEAIAIPEDEEKIFVSLDKIKDEIHALKEHDELVSRQAEQLQEEVEDLHVQVAKYKSRKDSAMGSDSESSILDHLHTQKSQLEEQVSSLQARLDKANRKISINEIHTESYIAERDEALKSATEHLDKIKRLQSELNTARQQLGSMDENDAQDVNTLELENRSLRKDNNSVRQQWKALLEENRSLREHNNSVSQQNAELEQDMKTAKAQLDLNKGEFETLQRECELLMEEKDVLKQDNLSLERHNDKFFNDNKVLKQQNSLLDRRTHDLQDEVARLNKLLDAATAETGTMPVDFKDIKCRLEVQNHELAKENAELQQQMIDMQSEFSTKRTTLEQEKRRLAAANERLKEQMDQIGKLSERIVQESKDEAAMFEEQQTALTQQLELIADKESALADKLRKSADHEAALQSELDRRTDAINEARQITQEIKDFMSTVSKKKHTKTPRIVEPKGKSVASETTARSTTSQTDMPIQDDYTQQISLTQGSDYASIFTQDEMPKLRNALRQVRTETQRKDLTNELSAFGDDDDMSDEASQSLPPCVSQGASRATGLHRTASGTSKGRPDSAKVQPVGILKDTQPSRLNGQKQKTVRTTTDTRSEEFRERDKTTDSVSGVRKPKSDDPIRKVSFGEPSIRNDPAKTAAERTGKDTRPVSEPDFSGRSSAKSGVSGMSIESETPEADKFHHRDSDSARFDIDDDDEDYEENMTSAFFMDDITLEEEEMAEKQNARKTSKAELSEDAKRVLDDLCDDHDCGNCFVCWRINSHRHGESSTDKKTVRIERPTDPRDQSPPHWKFEYEPTLRPSREPLAAVAKVIKTLKDEERHLLRAIKRLDAVYNQCDPSVNRRVWKNLGGKADKLRKARDLKRDQIYYLHDVIAGQHKYGFKITDEFIECTIDSALSKDDGTWHGLLDEIEILQEEED